MVNSVQCPLCVDGIGHEMDTVHADRVKQLLVIAKAYIDLCDVLGQVHDKASALMERL